VITRSGEKASFLAGGEVPVVSSIGNNVSSSPSVTFKPFGILFNVTPQAQLDGSIWLKLDLEVSQVSEALSYQNIPGFTTRKVSTNIILKEGNTAVLSGLVHNKDLKQVEKFPLLGSLPILGELFKSRKFQNQDTELWVAVTALRWNPEDQDINTYQNKILEKKFNSAKKFTQPSLID
jgi:pilus assembly protein CpaC